MTQHILVVDDDPDNAELAKDILSVGDWRVTTTGSVAQALQVVRREPVHCVLSDVCMPGGDGFSLLDTLKLERPGMPVILLTAFGGLDDAVRAVDRGAESYLPKPIRALALRTAVQTALDRAAATRRTVRAPSSPEIRPRESVVGRSAAIVSLYGTIARAANSTAPVLIHGETGVGKEWVARAIHRYSARAQMPFVPVNCSSFNEGTLESELFGHTRGGFTGAVASRKGLFMLANGGVLFLDEVGELPPRVQAELLRVLQEGEVRPVGSDDVMRVDVRVVCATHRDLDALVAAGRFRDDLLFRLRVIEIDVPPLRERREDIPALAEHFLAHAPTTPRSPPKRLAAETVDALMRRAWPGNVRELQSAVHRAAAMAAGEVVLPADLPPVIDEATVSSATGAAPTSLPHLWNQLLAHGVPTLDELELSFVRAVLRHLHDNKTQAAEALGVDRKTIRRILARGGDDED
ncbi:MAG: sigma-54 dependent transcriptional regulator [Polyangiales bacterium]